MIANSSSLSKLYLRYKRPIVIDRELTHESIARTEVSARDRYLGSLMCRIEIRRALCMENF